MVKLNRYAQEFIDYQGNQKFGGWTKFRVVSIETEPYKPMRQHPHWLPTNIGDEPLMIPARVDPGEHPTRIKMVVELSAEVYIVEGKCSICEKATPAPDHDALFFIMENHDGGRCVFAREDGCNDERDRYPVTGWEKIGEDFMCPDCKKEMLEAKALLKSKRLRTDANGSIEAAVTTLSEAEPRSTS